MSALKTIWIKCEISRGAFSGERGVTVELGSTKYEGLVPVGYLKTEDDQALDKDTPNGSPIQGKVRVQAASKKDAWVINLPDGEKLIGPPDLGKFRV